MSVSAKASRILYILTHVAILICTVYCYSADRTLGCGTWPVDYSQVCIMHQFVEDLDLQIHDLLATCMMWKEEMGNLQTVWAQKGTIPTQMSTVAALSDSGRVMERHVEAIIENKILLTDCRGLQYHVQFGSSQHIRRPLPNLKKGKHSSMVLYVFTCATNTNTSNWK